MSLWAHKTLDALNSLITVAASVQRHRHTSESALTLNSMSFTETLETFKCVAKKCVGESGRVCLCAITHSLYMNLIMSGICLQLQHFTWRPPCISYHSTAFLELHIRVLNTLCSSLHLPEEASSQKKPPGSPMRERDHSNEDTNPSRQSLQLHIVPRS